ncbi:MAG: hypothetical protein WKF77_23890 [Planctomycetaceae bacterium]
MRELDLAQSNLTDDGMVHVGNISTLQQLRISETGVTNAGLAY